MSRNGSGVYNLPAGNPVVTGTTVTSSWANTTMQNIADALTQSIASDGQTPMSGDLNMTGNYIHNLADPVTAQDAATKAYADALIAGSKTGVFTSLTDTGLTSGRVVYATTGGLLTDSSAFTYDGTTVSSTRFAGAFNGSLGATTPSTAVVTSLTNSGLTTGRVTYATTGGLLTDSANLTFNGTTLTTTNDASISGLTVGKGGGAVSSNTALGGNGTLALNTTGANNVAIGSGAGYASTTANNNISIGTNAGSSANTGSNVSVGVGANQSTTGSANTALGTNALILSTADNNTAVGYQAGYSNTVGAGNLFVGYQAGYTNSNQANCTYLGYQAGNLANGSNNTFVGIGSGGLVTSGAKNSIFGAYNGNQGGLDIRTSSNYIVLSDGDGNPRVYWNGNGEATTTGSSSSNPVFSARNTNGTTPNGVDIRFDSAAPNNTTQFAQRFGDNVAYRYYVWSNGNVVNSNNSYGAISDVKLKENIVDATPKLKDLCKVKVRQYNLKADPEHKQLGVIAQELQQIFPSMIDEFSDKDIKNNDLGTKTKSVKYSVFVPMLIKAIQELNAKVESLEAKLKG